MTPKLIVGVEPFGVQTIRRALGRATEADAAQTLGFTMPAPVPILRTLGAAQEIDTAATVGLMPPNTVLDSSPPAFTNDNTPTFTFHATAGFGASTFTVSIDQGTPSYVAPSGSGTHTPAALADGAYTFRVKATDSLGSPDPTPATYAFTVDTVAPDTTIT